MAKDEFILAVDTSTRHCAVALCRSADGCGPCDILAQSCVDRPRLHAERLLDGVHWVLDAAACPMDRVTCLAAAAGPGSFTGLRVGLATWKGLAFALQLPLVAVPTLDAMARLVPLSDGVVIPLLDARMREIFGAVYRYRDGVRETLVQEQVCPVDDLLTGGYMNERPLFFLGEGAWRYESILRAHAPQACLVSPACGTARADTVAEEACARMRAGCATDPAAAVPCYLRASQAEQARAARAAKSAGMPPA